MPTTANEISFILTGQRQRRIWYGRLVQRVAGGLASVEFDWGWVLEREERRGDIIGFYHTHPGGPMTPSQRDVRTMRAWASCLGKPLLCVIKAKSTLTAYVFATDNDNGQALAEVQRFPRNIIIGTESE